MKEGSGFRNGLNVKKKHYHSFFMMNCAPPLRPTTGKEEDLNKLRNILERMCFSGENRLGFK